MMKYLTVEDYQSSLFSLNTNNSDLEKYIALAEQDIEIITSIPNLNNLSEYQLETIKKILVQHTDFIIENYDYIYSIVDDYKTLETSFSIGSKNCIFINGVLILKKLYVLMIQTGIISTRI